MKLNKFIFGAAALALCSGAFAQTVTFHSGIDYTIWGLSQARYDNDGTTEKTDASAGYDPDGKMTVDVGVRAASFEFNLGLYFNADGGDEEFFDYSDGGKGTPFYKGNMKVGFLNDQIQLYTGKFHDFNAGYIANGAVLGTQYITNLADKNYGPYLTALEIAPQKVSGLKLFAGLPILPIRGNGIQTDWEGNQWKYLGKKIKLAATYQLPTGMSINAGFRPGTYYDGVDRGTMAIATDDSGSTTFNEKTAFTKSMFGEGFVQFVAPGIADKINLVASYDVRWRKAEYQTVNNTTKEHRPLAHMVGLSGEVALTDEITLAAEDRLFYAGDDYIVANEKLMYDILALNGEYALPGTQCRFGLGLAGIFASDAMGKGFSLNSKGNARVNNGAYATHGDITLALNDMATAKANGGEATKYLGSYAKPYFKYNFSNGDLIIACELAFTKAYTSKYTNTCFAYRVPIGVKFNF